MKRITLITLLAALMTLLAVAANAQDPATNPGNGNGVGGFIDEDGDGYNDLAPDADGDGIPNGQDEDYVRPEDGTGLQHAFGFLYKWGKVEEFAGHCFGRDGAAAGMGNSYSYGPGDGTAQSFGPGEAGGFGPGTGSGGPDDEDDATEGGTMQNRGGRR